jgi:hypothetical protein
MTPEEKAKELILRYLRIDNNTIQWFNLYMAKQCALIAVDEILNHHYQEQGLYRIDKYFWEQVKKEIENL